MGAGILSLPVVFRYLGIVLGFVFVLFIGATTIFSVYLLLKCREITGKK
jgi:amino acid permease